MSNNHDPFDPPPDVLDGADNKDGVTLRRPFSERAQAWVVRERLKSLGSGSVLENILFVVFLSLIILGGGYWLLSSSGA